MLVPKRRLLMMFYIPLKNINTEQKLNINQEQLRELNNLITILRPDEHISPYFISLRTNISRGIVIKILNQLAKRDLINIVYIIKCDNEDSDLVHEYEFSSDDELFEHYRELDGLCEQCEATLLSTEIRVAYQRKEIDEVGELNG